VQSRQFVASQQFHKPSPPFNEYAINPSLIILLANIAGVRKKRKELVQTALTLPTPLAGCVTHYTIKRGTPLYPVLSIIGVVNLARK
jgi:hypothetical protein